MQPEQFEAYLLKYFPDCFREHFPQTAEDYVKQRSQETQAADNFLEELMATQPKPTQPNGPKFLRRF